MRRIEVFEHGQPFLEVGDDRRLDDLARGLGHQPAHPGKLLDLRRRAAGARIRHHPYRVDRLTRRGRADHFHHLFGDLVGAARPDVDHLVVLLALGDQAILILLLVLLDLVLRLGHQNPLGIGDDQIVLAKGNPGLAGLRKAKRHQPVAEDNCLLLAGVAIDLVDDVADLLLGQQGVDQVKADRRIARQDLGQQHAARCRRDPLDNRLTVGVDRVIARLDRGHAATRPWLAAPARSRRCC